MTVTNKRTLTVPNERFDSDTQGSIQALDGTADGNMLLGYGSWATIREFNSKDQVIWTARFGPDAEICSYRSFKFDWHATPWYPPNMKVTTYESPTSRMSTHFYVSWNGATDVAKWNFYAQSSNKADPVLIGSVPKTEFETTFITEGYLDRVSVQAVLVDGTTLPRSALHRTELQPYYPESGWKKPHPDDPVDIAATAPNTAPDTVPEYAEVKGTSISGSNSNSTMSDSYMGLSKPSQFPHDNQKEAHLAIFCCGGSTLYEIQPWIEAAAPFIIVCSLVSGILMLIFCRRREKLPWDYV